MNKIFLRIFYILLTIILIGKMANWIFNFSEETNSLLNTLMYTLLGLGYIINAWDWERKLIQALFLLCGIYLISMNFLSDFNLKSLIGIICILAPLLYAKYTRETSNDEVIAEN